MLSEPSERRYITIPELREVTPPIGEPLGIQDYLNAANVKIKTQKDNLAQKIVMARQAVEEYTGRALVTRVVDQIISYDIEQPMDILTLRMPPVRKINGVYIYDPYGNESLVASTVYFKSMTSDPYTTIGLFPGQIWGSFLADFEAFRINTVCGYSTLVTSIDVISNVITATGHPYTNGEIVRLQLAYDDDTAPLVPGGLALFTNYYAINVSGDNLQLAATPIGAAIDITDEGSGKIFLGEIPEKLRRAILITAANDFLQDELAIENNEIIPAPVKNAIRSYKRTWI